MKNLRRLLLAFLFFAALAIPLHHATADTKTSTFTYKKVGDLEIQLDVHREDDERIRPLAVWIHGGALINGGRGGIGRAGRMLLDAGYCVVSIDYRLAPETKLPEIISDVEDAFRWIRKNGREKFHADTAKIAVLGGSAGGHLTLSTGFRVDPPPDVLVPFWGYGDLIGPWLSEPSPHHRHQSKKPTAEQLAAVETGPPVANSNDRSPDRDGGAYYQHCRQKGIWPQKVSGFDPATEAKKFDPFMAAKNVTSEYPPTLMIHGTEDTDVPHEQSAIMVREFEKHGVEHRLISIEGGEHGLGGGDPKDIEAAYAAVLPFIAKFVPPPVDVDTSDALRKSLTFHASFDGDLTANFAKGDPELYTMTASKPEVKNETGLHADSADLDHQKNAGRFGDCLNFKTTSAPRVFYQVEQNLPYASNDWQGTVSFWLRTTPDEDLEPGYTDPLQITPRSALDGCFFFEFGIEDPRPCRLGVFPDKLAWNPDNKPNKEIPIPERPLIEVQEPPFSREKWTHIVFTFEGFNNGDKKGIARLYLDGKASGEMDGWNQQYTWDLALAQIRLGVKFIGGFDELSCFDRALTAKEIAALHNLPKGVTAILDSSQPQAAIDSSPQTPLFETVDLNIGDKVNLADGGPTIKLIAVNEAKGEVWGEIAQPEVTVEVNGETATLVAGVYRLPTAVGGVQIDCPITGGLKKNSHIDHWALEKGARLRVWPSADSPWIRPGSFGYPVKQKWFASQTSFSNEPVAPRPNGQLYYHAGLDIGGCEELVEVVAATDALVVSVGNKIHPGHEPAAGSPVEPRYDVLYLLDERGWYYRYSHLHSFADGLRPGMRVKLGDSLGRLGKEGGSGGWTHLHFEIKARQPSGRWGTQEGYAFLWQGYRELYDPEIIAVARPGHVLFAGDTVTHDGLRSWSRNGTIEQHAWTFADGTTANTPTAEKSYPAPGTYIETLQVTDDTGASDYDFVRAKVFGRDADGKATDPPRLHATFHPSLKQVRAGETVTFKVRAFNTTHGEETWDFGDDSPTQKTKSDGNVKQLNKDGYAVVEHRYTSAGDYLVHVWRKDERGQHAEDRLHVRVAK